METIVKKKVARKKPRTRNIQSEEALDPVTIAEYVRRKNLLVREKDPTAPMVWPHSVNNAINGGYISVVVQGGNTFVDWERYKNYIFRTARRVHKSQ